MPNEQEQAEFRRRISNSLRGFQAVQQLDLKGRLEARHQALLEECTMMIEEIHQADPTGNSQLRSYLHPATDGSQHAILVLQLQNPNRASGEVRLRLWEESVDLIDGAMQAQVRGQDIKLRADRYDELRGLLRERVIAFFNETSARGG